ncbi:universal stress protein [Phenylobacterium immobile]|uniref:universal stress protein n=1 Tax=Phenylobacterium immobile TaxID=21 RepID=UPI001FDED137|nr:universal stress protein [Phenylobacterium immobile]
MPPPGADRLKPRVVACIDGSGYANSVCDHAAWMASRIEGDIEVLHVEDPQEPARASLVREAVSRLHEEGSPDATGRVAAGAFPLTATEGGPDLIVMGKRGITSEQDRGRLGSHVDRMIRATTVPVCLTSRFFLPIGRAVVLLDADMKHRAAVELVATHRGLHRLAIDLIVTARDGEDPAPKMAWARRALAARDADVFAMQANGPDDAAARYIGEKGADLIIISRAVLAPDPEARLGRIEEGAVWGWRTPVLVC